MRYTRRRLPKSVKEADMKRVTWLTLPLFVLALISWPKVSSAAAATKLAANALVKSVTATSLTVSGTDGKDMTFNVDSKTKVRGKGISTSVAAKGKGGRASITDLLGVGDRVNVTYQDMSGTLQATSVERTSKAMTTK
jgi:hypothetical protein